MLVYIFCCKGVIPSLWTCLTPCLFVANTVLQVGDRLVALENKIDETLTESISILKQVTLSLFNICFTTFPKIKKLLDHVLRRALERNMLKKLGFSPSGDCNWTSIWKSYISYSQDYEQQVAGVGQLVSKLSTETTNSTNDLETRLLVGFLELPKQFLFLKLDCRFFGFYLLWNLERISYSSDCSWKPHGFSRANFVGEGGRGENVSRKGGFRNLEIGEKVCRHL